MNTASKVTAAILLLGLVTSCGKNVAPRASVSADAEGEHRILNGKPDPFSNTADNGIVGIRIRSRNRGATMTCTGTVIAPRIVLSAAHCVTPTDNDVFSFEIFLGDDMNNAKQNAAPGLWIRVAEARKHPHFSHQLPAPRPYDIAVLVLERPVPTTTRIVPLGFRSFDPRGVGRPARLVGYGVGDIVNGKNVGAGVRRSGVTRILGLTPFLFVLGDVSDAVDGRDVSGYHGDSGGPMLMKDAYGWEYLVGVCRGQLDERVDKGTYTPIDLYRDFILANLASSL